MCEKKDKRGKNSEEKISGDKNPMMILTRGDKFFGSALLLGIIALSFLISFHTLSDTDIFHHLKTGQVILQTHQVPDKDIYSFTRSGKEWIDALWLFQIIISSLYRISGFAGIIFFGALLSAIIWGLILVNIYNSRRYFSILFLSLLCLVAASFRFKLRPELLSFFYLALELILLERHQQGKRYALYPLPLLLLLWLNSEGLWPLYFVVLSVFLFEQLLFIPDLRITRYLKRGSSLPAKKSALHLGIIFILSIPLVLLNPYGIRGALFPLKLYEEAFSSQNLVHQIIIEFRSPFSDLFPWFIKAPYIILVGFSSLLVIYFMINRRLSFSGFILWLIFLYLSLTAVRNVALFAIICMAVLGRALSENHTRENLFLLGVQPRLLKLRPVGGALILFCIIFFISAVISSRFFIWNRFFCRFGIGALETEYPIRAGGFLRAISTGLSKSGQLKIFSDLGSAGYLIWLGHPEWQLYIDPRMEVYGEEMLKRYLEALNHKDAFEREDVRYDFDAVVLDSFFQEKDLILALAKDTRWALIYLDGLNVIFIRNKPEFESVVKKYRIDFQKGVSSPAPKNLSGFWLARERLYRGYMLLMLGYPELAWLEFSAGLKIDSEEPNLNYYAGMALNQLNQPEQARFYLERLARKYPDSVKIKIQLARSYVLAGKSEQAVMILKQALKRSRDDLGACMELAKIYEFFGDAQADSQWLICFKIYETSPEKFSEMRDELFQALERMKNQSSNRE